MIDWNSDKNHILLNPRMPASDKERLFLAASKYPTTQHLIWICTSGSSGNFKLIALTKEAVLTSAAAVNTHLKSTKEDIWLNVLPFFHVGGLGISARAFLSGAKVITIDERWDPDVFFNKLTETKATLTSLVPAQLFDLINRQYHSPQSLRAVIVGGGALNEALYRKAIQMRWKILPSYGLTECASQVACAPLNSWKREVFPLLTPLSHVKLELNDDGYIKIKSPALFTASIDVTLQNAPLVNGWFTTEDKAELVNGEIRNVSRGELFIKIGGESCNLLRLEKIVESIRLELPYNSNCDIALIALPDERLGHTIHLAATSNSPKEYINHLVEKFKEQVLPFERIRNIHYVSKIPRSPLKKLLRSTLTKILCNYSPLRH